MLEHLASYDDEALLDELRRVAALIPGPKLSRTQFNAKSKVNESTIRNRFGGWKKALERAGLASRFDDSNSAFSKEEILSEMKIIALKLGKSQLTQAEFTANTGISSGPILRIFGSWKNAIVAAELTQVALGRRYSDDECFENLLAMWTQYARPPHHDEMNQPPSKVGAKAYVLRWGTWRKALEAFVAHVNEPVDVSKPNLVLPTQVKSDELVPDNRGTRGIPLGLRYFILKRDSFRCVLCGRSPALEHGLILHVDHIIAWANGGATVTDNLRTLCIHCNLGKSDKVE